MNSNARHQILQAVRRQQLEPVPHPGLDGPWIRYDDPRAKFIEMVAAVGGQARLAGDWAAAAQAIRSLDVYQSARRRYCQLPELDGDWNVDLAQVADPHELADLDLAVVRGQFGVAENGAVWVTDRDVAQRTAYFIAQHVVIVLPADALVHNLHEAYARLEFGDNAFGCFISGPSKTADIEQSLVIGAHGARSLTVFIP